MLIVLTTFRTSLLFSRKEFLGLRLLMRISVENFKNTATDDRNRCAPMEQYGTYSQEGSPCSVKLEGLKRGSRNMDTSDYQLVETTCDSPGENSKEIDEEVAREWEHTILQSTMDKELNELNKRLEQNESEMKLFGGFDTVALKQHFGKKLMELEDEKRVVQQERDVLVAEVESLAATSDGQAQKMHENHVLKLKTLEAEISDLKKKQENQVQLSKQKQKSDEAAKRLQEEIHFIKEQKDTDSKEECPFNVPAKESSHKK